MFEKTFQKNKITLMDLKIYKLYKRELLKIVNQTLIKYFCVKVSKSVLCKQLCVVV